MPLERPSLTDIDSALRADATSRLSGVNPLLRHSFLGALLRALAGGLHELYGYTAWVARQIFASSADGPQLRLQAAEWGIYPVPATAAAGAVAVTGTTGTVVPAETVWQGPGGQQYRSGAAATLVAGAATIQITAVTAGRAGNLPDGTRLALVSPLSGVVSTGAASGAIASGADAESDASLRARLLYRKRHPPHGGSTPDYRQWIDAADAQAHRAWIAPLSQMRSTDARVLGTVLVYYAPDAYAYNDDSDSDGTDDSWDDDANDAVGALFTRLRAYIQARRPATADVTVRAPAVRRVDMTISTLSPDTQAVRTAIEAELRDLIHRETEPGGTLLVSHIREAISTAEGETDHSLTTPVADVVAPQHTILVLGTITWP